MLVEFVQRNPERGDDGEDRKPDFRRRRRDALPERVDLAGAHAIANEPWESGVYALITDRAGRRVWEEVD